MYFVIFIMQSHGHVNSI